MIASITQLGCTVKSAVLSTIETPQGICGTQPYAAHVIVTLRGPEMEAFVTPTMTPCWGLSLASVGVKNTWWAPGVSAAGMATLDSAPLTPRAASGANVTHGGQCQGVPLVILTVGTVSANVW